MILVDTNIPLRIAQLGHAHRQPALDAIRLLTVRDREHFVVCPQSFYEMFVVCSRPVSANGFGMTPQRARAEVASARTLFQMLSETPQVYSTWEGLIAKYPVAGKRAHDVRLVAMMIEHRVPKLLTFNDEDFKQFVEIAAANPFDVLGLPRV